jgi:uncharacterized protein
VRLPKLGLGIVYWPGLEPVLDTDAGLVSVVEIEPPSLWYESPTTRQKFVINKRLANLVGSISQPKLVHGVGLPVGGYSPPDPTQLTPLLEIVDGLKAVWASEHLSFNQVHGPKGAFNTGFLLPPRQTERGVQAAAATIRSVTARMNVPFAVETGVNYLRPRSDEMSDGSFVQAVSELADCGILLDLHNVWANQLNGRQPVDDFLGEISLERVWEIHVAGGFELDGFWLDGHSGEVPPPVLKLAASLVPHLPNLGAIIFEILPQFVSSVGIPVICKQLEFLNEILELQPSTKNPAKLQPPFVGCHSATYRDDLPPADWENSLASLVVRGQPEGPFGEELAKDPGIAVLRRLVSEFRAGMITDALKLTTRVLLLSIGPDAFRDLLKKFWQTSTPELAASTEGQNFVQFLKREPLNVPFLTEVYEFELGIIEAFVSGRSCMIQFQHHPDSVLDALGEGRLPMNAVPGSYIVEVGGRAGEPPTISVRNSQTPLASTA